MAMTVFQCFGRKIAAEGIGEVRAHVALSRHGPLTDLSRFDIESVQKPGQPAWREGLALSVVGPRPILELPTSRYTDLCIAGFPALTASKSAGTTASPIRRLGTSGW